MLAAKQPLVVPMLLRLSHFKLNSYVVLVVSKQKGITLVFKTDPLQNVDINSTFDSIAVIQKFIQREIEGQLRQMFREDLPGIIHRLSQQWLKAKVEAPYLSKRPPPPARHTFDSRSSPDLSYLPPSISNVGLKPPLLRQQSMGPLGYRRSHSLSGISMASSSRRPSQAVPKPPPYPPHPPEAVTFPDLENFDPTYGLRPEGLPTKSLFSGFGSLFVPNKGLADLEEEDQSDEGDEYESDELASFDMVDWDNTVPGSSVYDDADEGTEYETSPAVGGGTITRPRTYHAQSPSELSPSFSRPSISRSQDYLSSNAASRSGMSTPALNYRHRQNSLFNPYFSNFPMPGLNNSTTSLPSDIRLYHRHLNSPLSAPPSRAYPGRSASPAETEPSRSSSGVTQSVATPPSSDLPHPDDEATIYMRKQEPSSVPSHNIDDAFYTGSPSNENDIPEPDPKIVLRPSLNNSIRQLSTLSHSNHTLSPYTLSMEHFTVRSGPPRGSAVGPSAPVERQAVKAKRKRIYRLGGPPKETPTPVTNVAIDPSQPSSSSPPLSPIPPSEFDASDMDRYFSHEFVPDSPDVYPTHVRRRMSASQQHCPA